MIMQKDDVFVLDVIPASLSVSHKYFVVVVSVVATLQHDDVDALEQVSLQTFIEARNP